MENSSKAIRKTASGKYEITSIVLDDGAGRSFYPKFKTLKAAKAYEIPAWAKKSNPFAP